VLYSFWDEWDLTKWRYGEPPDPTYFPTLERLIETVEREVRDNHGTDATVAHSLAELDAALATGRIAVVHTLEGGFHLGPTPARMDACLTEAAALGVASVAPAHLIYRGVATNSPAFPFLPDWLYHVIFRQPRLGLTDLGEALVRAMARERMLVDITHMSERSLADTFRLLDEVDPRRTLPVIASHMACRFGRLGYNITDDTIRRVAERGGALGVIFCDHFVGDGIRRTRTRTWSQTVDAIARHIDRIHTVTGSHDFAAIGSDLDGYIKPTLAGLEHMGRMGALAAALTERYGDDVAERICFGNAMRVLRAGWR
jgi:microsomal dipeptidase-like Zn-dependent dipeptidase